MLSHAERMRRIEAGDLTVVGVNAFTESAESPLGGADAILRVDPAVQDELIDDVGRWRSERDGAAVGQGPGGPDPGRLGNRQRHGPHHRPGPRRRHPRASGPTACEPCSASTGPPTGVSGAAGVVADGGRLRALAPSDAGRTRRPTPDPAGQTRPRRPFQRGRTDRGGGPGRRDGGHLRGHPPVSRADRRPWPRDEDPDTIGLSILSGSHLELVPATIERLKAEGVDVPLVVGGIIPDEDHQTLLDQGVAAIFTPKDYQLGDIVESLADLALAPTGRRRRAGAARFQGWAAEPVRAQRASSRFRWSWRMGLLDMTTRFGLPRSGPGRGRSLSRHRRPGRRRIGPEPPGRRPGPRRRPGLRGPRSPVGVGPLGPGSAGRRADGSQGPGRGRHDRRAARTRGTGAGRRAPARTPTPAPTPGIGPGHRRLAVVHRGRPRPVGNRQPDRPRDRPVQRRLLPGRPRRPDRRRSAPPPARGHGADRGRAGTPRRARSGRGDTGRRGHQDHPAGGRHRLPPQQRSLRPPVGGTPPRTGAIWTGGADTPRSS